MFYDKETVVKKAKHTEKLYFVMCFLTSMELTGISVALGVSSSSRTTRATLYLQNCTTTLVRPKERTAAILAPVDREMVRIKERDHHREDGIEVSHLRTSTLFLLTSP